MMYAPSDVRSIVVPIDSGGCGQNHQRGDAERLSVTCPGCEAYLALRPDIFGFATTLEKVSLTPDERAAAEVDQVTTDRALTGLFATLARITGTPMLAAAAVATNATPAAPATGTLADLTAEQLTAAGIALDAERAKRATVAA